MRKFAKRFVFILLIITFLLLTTSSNNSNSKINNILRSKYYSYLPKEAQDYIKEVYEDSGEIILTEKNKKVNTPYLNPQYINYLTLDEKEKEEVEVIPNTLKLADCLISKVILLISPTKLMISIEFPSPFVLSA